MHRLRVTLVIKTLIA